MTLSIRGDLSTEPNQNTFCGGCASGSNFYSVSTDARLRKWSISGSSMQLMTSAVIDATTPSGVTFISPASVVVAFSNNSSFDIIDANTLNKLSITTNATRTVRTYSQQIAGLPSLNLALATNNNSSGVTMVGLTCCAVFNPGAIFTSAVAQCIIPRLDTNTWLIGTNTGRILEMNSSGTIINNVPIPAVAFFQPFSGSTVVNYVTSLSYYNGILLVATDNGRLFTMSWPTGVLINAGVNFCGGVSFPVVLSAASSGTCIMGNNSGVASNTKCITEFYFENGNLNIDSNAYLETSTGITDLGIEPINQSYAWAFTTDTSYVQNRIYNITSTAKVFIQTEVQNPIGNDVGARIIRLRDCNDIGNACIELDQNILPGSPLLSATNNRNYVEVCLYGNIVNGNPPYTAWDIREFQA